jgi:hypothetical protein
MLGLSLHFRASGRAGEGLARMNRLPTTRQFFHLHEALNNRAIPRIIVTMRPSQIMRSGGDGEIGKYGK